MSGGTMIVDKKFCFEEETKLTVRKTSVFFPGDGFLVYDPDNQVIFRFDSYGPDPHPLDELVLMDASGKCLLTLHRKKPSLRQRWEGFLGERTDGQDPIFSVCRSSIIGGSSLVVEVYGDPGEEYHIEGSYPHRNCTIHNTTSDHTANITSSKEPVAVIKRKVDPSTNVMLGKDVFWLCLIAGFDGAFAMGLVLILDQLYGDAAAAANDDVEVDPKLEDSPSRSLFFSTVFGRN